MRQEVMEVIKADSARVEDACERALLGGEHGVLVVRRSAWPDWRATGVQSAILSAEPDPRVPYGHIYEVDQDDWTPRGVSVDE